MSDMFSSPSKQAQSAASSQQGLSDAAISKAENYVNQQEQGLRNAIGGLPPNPYLSATSGFGGNIGPANYQLAGTATNGPSTTPNPALFQAFGSSAPTSTAGNPFSVAPANLALPNPSNNPFLRSGASTRSVS